MNFAVVLFPEAEELDFAGPFEVFGMAAKIYKDWNIFTVAATPQVKGAIGLSINADYTFDDAPAADVIIVPGGQGTRPGENDATLMGYIQRAGKDAQWVTSVCTGAFLLQKAGFLDGKRATTYWAMRDELQKRDGVTVVKERWVRDGNVITAAGVSAGIDMALYLVGQIKGEDEARRVQKMIEYDPAPPYQEAGG